MRSQWRPSLAKPGLDDTLSLTSLLSIPRDIARGVFERRALDLYDQANDVDREHDAEQDALLVDHVQAVHAVAVQLGHHVREPLRREDGPRRLTGVGMRCVLRVRASLVMIRCATDASKFHVVIDNLKKGILVENLRKHGFDP